MTLASDKRILVVDDEPDIRDFLSTCVEDAGFQVQTAFDGQDALEKIEKNPPDLITLDLAMPRMTGSELMKKLCLQTSDSSSPSGSNRSAPE